MQYSLFRQNWNIGVTPHAVTVVAGLEGGDKQRRALDEVTWMAERRGTFAADPFIVPSTLGAANEFFVLYEHFPWDLDRGLIYRVPFSGGSFGKPVSVLDTPYHLSYPFVTEWGGSLAMLPEHSASHDLSYYQLDSNCEVVDKQTISRHLALVDSTLLHWNDNYWIFATQAGELDNIELHIYYSDNMHGPWVAHAQNPVKRDLSNARPAGQFIQYRDKIFRPAQDCSSHYGAGVIVNEVITLTKDVYDEQPVSEIRPVAGGRYDYGLHTVTTGNGYTAIDGARMESVIHERFDWLGRFLRPRAS